MTPMPLELFPFKYRSALTGRWVKARYKASREELAARYPQGFEITGPAEVREAATPSSLTAGHLASSPAASENVPSDLRVGDVLEPGGRGEG
jgi:hypothetical protein